MVLQEPQQGELENCRRCRRFRPEHGAAVGGLEDAGAVAVGAGVKRHARRRTNRFSSSDGAMEPQSTAANGWAARRLLRQIMRATTSLPVPVSPSMMTVASVGATRAIIL